MNKMKIAVLAIVVLSLAAGCVYSPDGMKIALTPRAKLAIGYETFNGIVNTLAALREGGAFTKAEADQISILFDIGQNILFRWEASIETGHVPASVLNEFNTLVRELIAIRIMGERKVNEDGSGNNSDAD